LVAKAEGRIATAETLLREAVALLDEQDPYRFMRWCLAELASVAALAGDQEAAAGWLDRADARGGEANRFFNPWVELDRAWVAAGTGELTKAAELAAQAAEMARDSGQFTLEALALHDVARLGVPTAVRERLEELAGLLEGRLASVLATSAVALAARDGAALDHPDRVAEQAPQRRLVGGGRSLGGQPLPPRFAGLVVHDSPGHFPRNHVHNHLSGPRWKFVGGHAAVASGPASWAARRSRRSLRSLVV
jgi:hypothetical protein